MKKIIFTDKTPLAYRGRNGMGKMSGIEVHSVPAGYVSLNPITSKGIASDAAILEIQNDDTIAVCAAILDIDQKKLWATYCMLKGVRVRCISLDVRISGAIGLIVAIGSNVRFLPDTDGNPTTVNLSDLVPL